MISINTSKIYTFVDIVKKLIEIRNYFKHPEGKAYEQAPQKIVYATRIPIPKTVFNDEYSFYIGLHDSNPLETLRNTMFIVAADDLTAEWQLRLNEKHELKKEITVCKN